MEKLHETRDVDLTGAARGVWLVKVPKYLSEKWHKTSGEVGKLRISKPKTTGGKPEVIFTLNEGLCGQSPDESTPVPRDHKFVLTGIANQSLSIIGRELESSPGGEPMPERVSVEGKVIQRAECRPIPDKRYMDLKRVKMEAVNKPQKQVVQLDKAVLSYKPISQHANEIEYIKKKKDEGKKSRLEKDQVHELLFSAFEKHQYYNVKDLVRITDQPITYLKEVLKEICTYNMKAPHKNMWELKPEYRHYKEPEGSATS